MPAFLDFEAAGLDETLSYPIEVGWTFGRGRARSTLILPHPDWTYWDPGAQAMHGISLAQLRAEGLPGPAVAKWLNNELGGQTVLVSAVDDLRWKDMLFEKAATVCRFTMIEIGRAIEQAAHKRGLDIEQVRADIRARTPYNHRAGGDALYLRGLWKAVGSPLPLIDSVAVPPRHSRP